MSLILYPAFYLWFFVTVAGWIYVGVLMFRIGRRTSRELFGSGLCLVLLGLAANALWSLVWLVPDGLRPELLSSPFPWLIGAVPMVSGAITLIACRARPAGA